MNADNVNMGLPKPGISMVEAVGSNSGPGPRKSNKRKNHRGGRKTKKKQNSSTGQDTITTPKDAAVISTIEAIVPTLAKKQKHRNRKRRRKSAKAPPETAIQASDTVTETQDDFAICISKQDYVSPLAQDDSTRPSHHSADPSPLELSPSRGVDKDTSGRAEDPEAISAVEQESLSGREEASGDIAIYGRDGLEARFKSVTTMAETSQGQY